MRYVPLAALLLVSGTTVAQPSFTAAEQVLIDEHVFAGLPSTDDIFVRQGYVLSFDHERRVPRWVAYHITPEYRDTPPRSGRFFTFRVDPDIEGEARFDEYTGFHATRGYARGHMAPYAVMGGDRDGDGLTAEEDEDDFLTIAQANYMSNMAPQHQRAFNGAGGIWNKAERWVQNDLVVGQGREVWVFAGTIFGPARYDAIGPRKDIEVPPLFYKIVITQTPLQEVPRVLAFLLPHHRTPHGDIEDFLVSIDIIEALTGLDFFSELEDDIEIGLEDQDTAAVWEGF